MNGKPFGSGLAAAVARRVPEWKRHRCAQDVIDHGLHKHHRRPDMNRQTGMNAGQILGMTCGLQVVGLDIAKLVFQMHTVDMATGEIVNVQIKRAKVLEHFANRAPCLIAMEACGGAHHWARALRALGHEVRLLHARAVRPFVSGNKTDAADARAIWLAVQQPGTKFVGVKSLAQQATLTLHRQRALLMKMRTMQTNALRGLLYEFGATFAKGTQVMLGEVEAALDALSAKLPTCGASPRFRAWACSRPRRRLPPWAIRAPSLQRASSAPGWVWCPGNGARAARCACRASPSGATATCARC